MVGEPGAVSRFEQIAVYIMTDSRYGVLYTGVTATLLNRIGQHRAGEGSIFTRKYNCKRLAWYELHGDMRVAIQREKSIKRYSRQWKINLIEEMNPDWHDLWDQIRPQPFPGQRHTVDELRRGLVDDPVEKGRSRRRSNRDPRDALRLPEDDGG